MTPPARLLAVALRLYQWTVRPLIPGCCRFEPGCSDYALQALREHGAARGSALAAWRVLRCHPFCDGGYDPVPPCRCEGSKQGRALPEPAKGQGLWTPIYLDKWFSKASLWRGPGAKPLALLPSPPAPAPRSRHRSLV